MNLEPELTVFMFHDIRDPPYICPKRYLMRSYLQTETFNERLDFIQKNYCIVPLEDIVLKKTLPKAEKYACLTFDDGLVDHYNTVFPILKYRKIHGTFFIPSDCIYTQNLINSHKIQFIIGYCENISKMVQDILKEFGQDIWEIYSKSLFPNNWWSKEEIFITRFLRTDPIKQDKTKLIDFLYERIPKPKNFYMSLDQIKEIIRDGFGIGGHGNYSLDLSKIPTEEQEKEIVSSKTFLESLGIKTFLFSFPNGGYSVESLNILKANGFQGAVITGEKTCSIFPSNIFNIPRIDGAQFSPFPKIVLCGVQEQGLEITNFLQKNNIPITNIITIDEKEAKRQKAAGWVKYNTNIELYNAKHYGFKSEEDVLYFHKKRFDILILGGWQRLIPNDILKLIKYGGIGQHGSSEFLPKNRGRSPLNWSIILGKKRLIWNLFSMTANIDDGDILDFEIFDINEWDTCETMYFKVSIAVKYMLKRTIPKILSNNIIKYPQIGEPTYYAKREPKNGKINWNSSVFEIHRLIRAVTKPYPGAFTIKNNKNIMIWEAQPFSQQLPFYINAQYGEIVEVFNNKYLVKAEEGLLLIINSDDENPKVGDIYI